MEVGLGPIRGREREEKIGWISKPPVRVLDWGLSDGQEQNHLPLRSCPMKGYPGAPQMSWSTLQAACHLATSSHTFSHFCFSLPYLSSRGAGLSLELQTLTLEP